VATATQRHVCLGMSGRKVLTVADLPTETAREYYKNLYQEAPDKEALTCARLAREAERIHSGHRKQLDSGENAAKAVTGPPQRGHCRG
jgi:hypothetical protein